MTAGAPRGGRFVGGSPPHTHAFQPAQHLQLEPDSWTGPGPHFNFKRRRDAAGSYSVSGACAARNGNEVFAEHGRRLWKSPQTASTPGGILLGWERQESQVTTGLALTAAGAVSPHQAQMDLELWAQCPGRQRRSTLWRPHRLRDHRICQAHPRAVKMHSRQRRSKHTSSRPRRQWWCTL